MASGNRHGTASGAASGCSAWRRKREANAEQNALRPTITRISWGRQRYGKGRIVRDAKGAQVFVYDDQADIHTDDLAAAATSGAVWASPGTLGCAVHATMMTQRWRTLGSAQGVGI